MAKRSVEEIKRCALRVKMLDGSRWDVPVAVIAEDRANCNKSEFGGDLQRSLDEDTWPCFADDDFEVEDWAENNMNWDDVKAHAVQTERPQVYYQDGWVNGEKEIVSKGGDK